MEEWLKFSLHFLDVCLITRGGKAISNNSKEKRKLILSPGERE